MTTTTSARGMLAPLVTPFAAGSLVAVALGVYGRLHEPTRYAVDVAGFSSGVAAKAWLTTVAGVLALVQLATSPAMVGRVRRGGVRAGAVALHRWSGRAAVLASVPVAMHCLWALGFQSFDGRVVAHSLLGCFFYGAFVTKMLLVGRQAAPRWGIPLLGGALLTAVTGLWLTSSLWFFSTAGLVR
jgi:hypothetical protein